MVSNRPYRSGMPPEGAEEILRDGAGTQWLSAVVDAVLSEARLGGPVVEPRFANVGRTTAAESQQDDYLDACLPRRAILSSVH